MIQARRLTTVVGLAIATAVTAVSFPAVASGSTAPVKSGRQLAWVCDPGYLCLYEKTQGRGLRCQFRENHPDLWKGRFRCKGNKRVLPRSAYNKSSWAFNLWSDTNYRGVRTVVGKGSKVGDIPDGVRSIKRR